MSWYRQQQQKSADDYRKSMKDVRKQRLAMQNRKAKHTMDYTNSDFDDSMDYKRSRLEQDSDD
jgi:hypothetical protein